MDRNLSVDVLENIMYQVSYIDRKCSFFRQRLSNKIQLKQETQFMTTGSLVRFSHKWKRLPIATGNPCILIAFRKLCSLIHWLTWWAAQSHPLMLLCHHQGVHCILGGGGGGVVLELPPGKGTLVPFVPSLLCQEESLPCPTRSTQICVGYFAGTRSSGSGKVD